MKKNGLPGLSLLGELDHNIEKGTHNYDIFHLNDVEPFPESMEEGFFTHGDMLLSLRNISTVIVYNVDSEELKLVMTGQFVRQHDPDFIDGNTFSVFDNNNDGSRNPADRHSKIVIVNAQQKTTKIYFQGTPEQPFFTSIMGKHQWLPNGHLLITEPRSGRGFEINQSGEIIWQYVNYLDYSVYSNDSIVGLVSEFQRLSGAYRNIFPVALP